jgi:hypothetical protein
MNIDPRIFYSFQSAIVFFIIASPFMYSLTKPITKMVGGGEYGPVAVHSLVFGIIVYILMIIQ